MVGLSAYEREFVQSMRDAAISAVDNSISTPNGPMYMDRPELSEKAIQDAFIAMIDEFITGCMILCKDSKERKEIYMRLVHMTDMIPAWVSEVDKDGYDLDEEDYKRLFGEGDCD